MQPERWGFQFHGHGVQRGEAAYRGAGLYRGAHHHTIVSAQVEIGWGRNIKRNGLLGGVERRVDDWAGGQRHAALFEDRLHLSMAAEPR